MRVVLDTMIVVNKKRACDADCEEAFDLTVSSKHALLVCPKLLDEYRRIIAGHNPSMHAYIDRWLSNEFGPELFLRRPDPTEKIDFGPKEDRFHLQLAIDEGANFHVTRERAILAEAAKMRKFGVRETSPGNYVTSCRVAALR